MVVKNKLIISLISLTLVGSTTGFLVKKNIEKKAQAVFSDIREQKVVQGDIRIELLADGQVSLPVTFVDFEVQGKIKEIPVKSGQEVKKGDLLARIVADGFEDNLLKSETAYKKAMLSAIDSEKQVKLQLIAEKQKLEDLYEKYESLKSSTALQLATEKEKLDDLIETFKKVEDEYRPMIEAPDAYTRTETDAKKQQYENAKEAWDAQAAKYDSLLLQLNGDLEVAKRSYDVQKERYDLMIGTGSNAGEIAKVTLEDAKNNLELAKENLSKTVLVAPESGKILYISKKVGDIFNPSANANNTNNSVAAGHFMVLLGSGSSNVKTNITESDIKNISFGQRVEVQIEAAGDEVFKGKVSEINSLPKIDSNGVVTYEVTVELETKSKQIMEGMTCLVNFIFKEKKNVLYIPNKVVIAEDGKQYAEVMESDGKIVKKQIQTGFSNGEKVEIISGLAKGETVITRGVKK
jgi:HlyD family secretion protein